MNVGLILTKVTTGLKRFCGPTWLVAKKHAPEALMVMGIGGVGLTVYETVKATNKTNDILAYKECKEELIAREASENPTYTAEFQISDEKNLKRDTRIELAKAWTPAALTVIFTILCFCGVYKIVDGRLVAVSGAYEGLQKIHDRYRQNVRDEYGDEVDWRMAHSVKADEMSKEREAQDRARKDAEAKEAKKQTKPRTQYDKNVNNQILDIHSCRRWQRYWTPDQFIDFIRYAESKLQDKVDMEGSAVLNDGFDILGMPRTSQGAILGWVQTPRNKHNIPGKTMVSLGFANNETPDEEIRRILSTQNNEELYAWITPNCDGVIYNLIDTPFHLR